MNEKKEDAVLSRHRIAITSGRSDDLFDDDLPDEDTLLSEIVTEDVRLKRLKEIQTPYEECKSEIYISSCRLLAKTFKAPISLLSLVYDEFQWFKANVGSDVPQTNRCLSFCAHTFEPKKPEVLYVPDALEDTRFAQNDLVLSKPNIRFYCGVPLVTQDGVRLGALCVIDTKPRRMSRKGFQFLMNLAELTVRELLQTDVGSRYKPAALFAFDPMKFRRIPTVSQMHRLREQWFEKGLTEGILIIDIELPTWCIVWANDQWEAWSKGSKIDGIENPDIWNILQPMDDSTGMDTQNKILKDIASGDSCSFLASIGRLGGKSSVTVSCDVVSPTVPFEDVKNNIGMPSESIVAPADAEPILFEGDHLIIVFVSHAPEDLASADAMTPEAEQDYKAATANIALSGAALTPQTPEAPRNPRNPRRLPPK